MKYNFVGFFIRLVFFIYILVSLKQTIAAEMYIKSIPRKYVYKKFKIIEISLAQNTLYDLKIEKDIGVIHIANPAIANYILFPKTKSDPYYILRLQALKPGMTYIAINEKTTNRKFLEIHLTVTTKPIFNIYNTLKRLTKYIEGVKFRIMPDRLVISANLYTPNDLNDLIDAINSVGAKKGEITLDVRLSRKAMDIICQKMVQAVKNYIGVDIKVKYLNSTFVVEGIVESEAIVKKVLKILTLYVPAKLKESAASSGLIKKPKLPTILNLLRVKVPPPKPTPPLVWCLLSVGSFNRLYSSLKSFQMVPSIKDNIQFEIDPINYILGNNPITANFTTTLTNIFPKYNAGKTFSKSAFYTYPALFTISGKRATLKDQLKLPYNTYDKNGAIITKFANIGLNFSITPVVSDDNITITSKVDISLSSLTAITSSGPSTKNYSLSTIVKQDNNSTIILGGDFLDKVSKDYNKLPQNFAQGTTPLFKIQRSIQAERSQGQFAFFLNLKTIKNIKEFSKNILNKFRYKH